MPKNQGLIITTDRWKLLTDLNGIDLRLSGVQPHSPLGVGERLLDPLRRMFRKITRDCPNVNQKPVLKTAVRAINDTIHENGLVPRRLVFGVIRGFPIISPDTQERKEGMTVLNAGQAKINANIAKEKFPLR